MKFIYSMLLGLALGTSSVFLYSLFPPVGLVLSISATCLGIWAAGRKWGGRSYRFVAAIAWTLIVLRAGFPGLNNEYLILGDTLGTSLINIGFVAVLLSIMTPL
jgi:hypothetical protein